MNDTSPEITSLVHARLMAKSGAERFLMGVRMHEAARRMVMASFPAGLSPSQQRRLLKERFYGAGMAFGEGGGVGGFLVGDGAPSTATTSSPMPASNRAVRRAAR